MEPHPEGHAEQEAGHGLVQPRRPGVTRQPEAVGIGRHVVDGKPQPDAERGGSPPASSRRGS